MTKVIRAQLVTLFALLTALVMTLAACGGGGSSAGSGGGSGSTIAGTVNSGLAAVPPAGAAQTVFTTAMDLLIEPARATGVAGVTVELLNAGGMAVDSQTTGPNGRFIFRGLAPGNYSIRLSQGDAPLGQTVPVQVASNSRTELELDVSGSVLSVEIESEGGTIAGEVEDDASSDDLSSDDTSSDDDSVDGQSADLDSNDDDSADDDSSDDDSGATV